jgi:hypothetical protein
MKSRLWTLLLTAALIAAAGGYGSTQKGKGKGSEKEKETAAAQDKGGSTVAVHVSITKADRELIKGWFHDNAAELPPGLAKREQLPPGLQKQLVKNGTLPPGLQKKLQPLPVALEHQLPPLPAGYQRLMVGVNMVIMNQKSKLIADVLYDAIH